MIVRRVNARGRPSYMPLVYNPQVGRKQGARQILGVAGTYAKERDAAKVERRMAAAVEDWVPPEQRPATVGGFVDRWLEEWPRRKATTNRHYAQQLRALTAMYGDVLMRDFSRDMARKFANQHRPNARVAKAMFNDAIYEAELRGLGANPFERLKLEQHSRERRTLALTGQEVAALADAAGAVGGWGLQLRAAVVVSAYTGLRLGELCAMDWDWLNKDRSRLTVRRQMTRGGAFTSTKNGTGDTPDAKGAPQTIAVLPPAAEVLAGLPRSLSGAVFTLPNGGRVTHGSLGHYWRQARAVFLARQHRDGVEGLVWHTLRHTTSTLLIEAGFDRFQVQQQLRHSSPALVDAVYTHIDREAAFDRMVEAFAPSGLGHILGDVGAGSS